MPGTNVTTYDPAQVQVVVGGAILTGFEPVTFINIVRSVNNFITTIGPDGKELIRTKSNDRSALMTLTLRQVSAVNLILANLANRDEVDSDGVVPIMVKEIGTDTEFISAKGWIEKPADASYAETPQGRAWAFMLAEVPMGHAGNPTTPALQGTLT